MSDTIRETPAYLLAGGRPSNTADMVRMISRAYSAVENPLVAYIGTANGDSLVFYKMMQALLMRAGARKVTFARLAKEKVNVDEVKSILSSADIIFLSGGEVEDGINWLRKHRLVEFLKELYSGGKQFIGVSAGSIMMGSHWVRWENPDDDATAELFDCLGIIPAVFDTHAEAEDWIELKTVLRLQGNGARGYGIPTGGMISADSNCAFVSLEPEKDLITFVNENGQIQIL